jgi:hypothetical protein
MSVMAGEPECARRHFAVAREKTKSPFDRELIDRRLAECRRDEISQASVAS